MDTLARFHLENSRILFQLVLKGVRSRPFRRVEIIMNPLSEKVTSVTIEQGDWKRTIVITLVIPSDFKNDKNQKIMFFGDIYLYF